VIADAVQPRIGIMGLQVMLDGRFQLRGALELIQEADDSCGRLGASVAARMRSLSRAANVRRGGRTVTIAGIELLCWIHKGQFGSLRLKDRSTPAVWNAVLATA
jgi:hypothetical protein